MGTVHKLQNRFFDERGDEMIIRNPLSIDLTQFKFALGFTKHLVKKTEVVKPYLISEVNYGTDVYEDIILLLNGVEDPFQLIPGTELLIPHIDELQDFLLANRVTEDDLSVQDPG